MCLLHSTSTLQIAIYDHTVWPGIKQAWPLTFTKERKAWTLSAYGQGTLQTSCSVLAEAWCILHIIKLKTSYNYKFDIKSSRPLYTKSFIWSVCFDIFTTQGRSWEGKKNLLESQWWYFEGNQFIKCMLYLLLWKMLPLKCRLTSGDEPWPFSPVHSARKFSAVLGTLSANSSKAMRPTEKHNIYRFSTVLVVTK